MSSIMQIELIDSSNTDLKDDYKLNNDVLKFYMKFEH